MLKKPSKNWIRTAKAYEYFAKAYDSTDFSDLAAIEMYNSETYGHPNITYYIKNDRGLFNGFAIGKHWMDVTIAMWVEDIASGLLLKHELLEDDNVPEVLKEIISNIPSSKHILLRNKDE